MFILMLRVSVGSLWLQSIQNLLYVKSCVCDSLYLKHVSDYNTHMHSVDTADQYLAHHPFIRKIVKWPKYFLYIYLLHPKGCYTRYHTLKHY
jgi:hypothetical protein